MTSVLLCVDASTAAGLKASDINGGGLQLLHVVDDCNNLVQDAVHHAPDVVVCALTTPGEVFFAATRALADGNPCPVLVFTSDEDAGHIVRAIDCGVHAWVINGYAIERLPSLVRVAQARFAHEQALRQACTDATNRLEERKSVDRAKAILMKARVLSDDDAFRVLRTASMHSNQRMVDVSQHIIHSAHFAEGVNRAGQLRMLSQRLVKLHLNIHLMQQARLPPGLQAEQLKDSVQRIDANLLWLRNGFAKPEFGDLVDRVGNTWADLKRELKAVPGDHVTDAMIRVNGLAEQLLAGAENLTGKLEIFGAIAPLQVLNRAGRQRMLSQRFAKYALLEGMGDAAVGERCRVAMGETRLAFEQTQHYLNNLPLSTPDIRRLLEAARLGWQQMLAGVPDTRRLVGQQRLAIASEELLQVFEQLSASYESSMQMLVG
ncbi:MAG: type IV pili methyl-accepting chemotaxis transducer N-terminal domain-containing protein [Polaromonas sp.]